MKERKGIGFFEGFLGTVEGSFYKTPRWVDLDKAPGYTSMEDVLYQKGWVMDIFNPVKWLWSVTPIWCAVAALVYWAFPYDLESVEAKEMQWSLVVERIWIHFWTMHCFVGFWHVTIYLFKFSTRNFSQTIEGPSKSRLFHNMYYSTLGAIQSAIWDCAFIYIYANKILPYTPDSEAFSLSPKGFLNAAVIILVGYWRDLHFYCAHRLIHIRFIYKYVHSLHHRNTQIEPYAGLCMHPVEHLFYYSCAGAMLLFNLSPFVPFYVLVHALISPAASHSGFEDNWQSDQFHNIHHTKFECNYGSSGLPMDYAFGTWREKLGKSNTYKGAFDEPDEPPPKDGKKLEYLRGSLTITGALWANSEHAIYDILTSVVLPAFTLHCFTAKSGSVFTPHEVASAVTFFPILVGFLLWFTTDKQSWRWPFHKEPLFGKFGFFTVLAAVVVLAPTYVTVYYAMM
eukprot:TRINITY_DN21320_c0_g1_i1.p1 TRINITY_DN21320_c0_g1~~TRINITY_DN21320_c0_g1_i1.p1  ORF type:complete len:454 (+),score=78.99 TRINITY_DN21320_c0_g1_i1:53-1414(+)